MSQPQGMKFVTLFQCRSRCYKQGKYIFTQKSNNTNKESSTNKIKKTRNRWTKEQRLELFRCYCIAVNSKLEVPATKWTSKVSRERNPNIHPKITSNTLNTARRYAESILCDMEKDEIRKEEENKDQMAPPSPVTKDSLIEGPSPDVSIIKIPTEVGKEESEVEDSKWNEEMMNNLIVMFKRTKIMKLEVKLRPKRYDMTKEINYMR